MVYYIAAKDFSSTSKSAGIVPFLKLSAQCLHYNLINELRQFVCRKNNYSLDIIIFILINYMINQHYQVQYNNNLMISIYIYHIRIT